MNLDNVIGTFIAESRELLLQMEDALLQIEQSPDDPELINAIFRAAHTIKGSSGLFGFDSIVAFTHVAESVLDRVRAGELPFSADLSALMLLVGDHLTGLVDHVAEGLDLTELPQDRCLHEAELVARLSQYLGVAAAHTAPASVEPATLSGDGVASRHWHLSLRFGIDSLRNGMDPVAFVRYLRTFGELRHVEPVVDHLPVLDALDPEACYLGLEVAFASEADRAVIEGAFDFVREDGRIRILAPGDSLARYAELLAEQLDEGDAQRQRLLRCGTLSEAELAQLSATPATESTQATVPDAAGSADPSDSSVVGKPAKETTRASGEANLIRVDAGKLDQLINLVGELIIAGANTRMLAQGSGLVSMSESAETLSRLVEEVRDSALTLRMVQIGTTFNRFQRVVRDVSKELSKDIVLYISGGDTELDKTVVEKIGDPLTHLVRNAMDHGIESAEQRQASDKPLQGVVRLNAYHEAGGIVIEVSDDGGGLNPQKILAKAIQRGLVSEGQQLPDKDIFNLIFEPGFSTAEQISNISGRGVGMDVVKRNITALRGTVELDSQLGVGTRVRIRLPLTLAIIDGFLIGVGTSSYVVPLDMVEECIELPSVDLDDLDQLDLRGDVLPFIRLRNLFDETSPRPRRENVVVVSYAGVRAGLVVDQLLGEFQTVIKPLGKVFGQVPALSGFTILGSGAVALILDIPGLLAQFTQPARPTASGVALPQWSSQP
ncbi:MULTISPECIES: chemotaxis protein CheA [Pseudomonas]|uniref:Chemotaxis protein CheA n=1 Tax=Pseudomonas asplenii TaxID=53407 RepID=A0A0N0E3G6_9PSED|nr:chemotaxis protein CheA [Pseudomonas fuscovaginae]KPA90059.1 chemotaxis protein histidine kinase-like protein [Pseudomonas fuscovaginae]KPA97057.1 chemotaxis protein histidine kinase-like protein [Pseudomonas fuscovaginae]